MCTNTQRCKYRLCAMIYILISSLFFLGLAIGMLAAGSVMSFPTDSNFLKEGCAHAANGDFDKI